VPSSKESPSTSGADIGVRAPTLLLVEHHEVNTYTVVRLTCTPAIARWLKRCIVGLLAWVTAATTRLFMSMFDLHLW
jgi:hypothetical protein